MTASVPLGDTVGAEVGTDVAGPVVGDIVGIKVVGIEEGCANVGAGVGSELAGARVGNSVGIKVGAGVTGAPVAAIQSQPYPSPAHVAAQPRRTFRIAHRSWLLLLSTEHGISEP